MNTLRFLSLLLLLALSSCNFMTYNKAYVASAPHVADLNTGAHKAKGLFNLTDIELQFATPLSEHWGLTANGLLGVTGQYIGEIGAVYFINGDYRYFEVSAGVGRAHINSEVRAIPDQPLFFPGLATDLYYFHTIQSDYYKLYVQPSFLFNISDNLRIGPTLKLASLYFTQYNYDYKIDSYQGSGYRGVKEVDYMTFNNKWGINAEPVLNMKWTKRRNRWQWLSRRDPSFVLQVGASFSSTVVTSEVFQTAFEPTPAGVREFKHPKQNNFILNFGLELSL